MKLDRALARKIVDGLGRIPPDAKPHWGKMNRDQLYGHLALVVRYSMGQLPSLPFKGNWFLRTVARRLVLNGIVQIPRNVRLPRPKGMDRDIEPPTCALSDLEQALDEYLGSIERGETPSALHPFFGQLSTNEWLKFHARHFKHHCTQFGVW